MTTEEAKMRAELYSALADGKTIQIISSNGTWEDIKIEELKNIYDCNSYRIKPEPKYRPFKNQEECWQEMHKHIDFGWIRNKNTKELFNITNIFSNAIRLTNYNEKFSSTISRFEFLDGETFGIKDE